MKRILKKILADNYKDDKKNNQNVDPNTWYFVEDKKYPLRLKLTLRTNPK